MERNDAVWVPGVCLGLNPHGRTSRSWPPYPWHPIAWAGDSELSS
jgi:hypothetical protein